MEKENGNNTTEMNDSASEIDETEEVAEGQSEDSPLDTTQTVSVASTSLLKSFDPLYEEKSVFTPEESDLSEGVEEEDTDSDKQEVDKPEPGLDTTRSIAVEETEKTDAEDESKKDLEDITVDVEKEEVPVNGGEENLSVGTNLNVTVISKTEENPLEPEMLDDNEKLAQQQEVANLKLQLNASQQTIASLKLKIKQLEEVIIKNETEYLKDVESFSAKIRKLQHEVDVKTSQVLACGYEELTKAIDLANAQAEEKQELLSIRINEVNHLTQIINERASIINEQAIDIHKLREENEMARGHLASLEMAFNDVHAKYERAKTIIDGFKKNEDILKKNIDICQNNLKTEAERYESLKAHARGQIEKANKENTEMKETYELAIAKQNAIIKRLEIKCVALQDSLDQKTKECTELSALCDEVTGKKM